LLRIRLTKVEYNEFANWISIEGTVKNIGTQEVFSPTLLGDAYAKDGTLLGQSQTTPAGQFFTRMLPGVAAGFSMLISASGGRPSSAWIEAKNVDYELFWTDQKLSHGRRNGRQFRVKNGKEVFQ
jgi:hypothetical protein